MKPFSAPLLEGSLSGVPLMTTVLLGCSVRYQLITVGIGLADLTNEQAGFLLFGYDQ